MFHEIVTNPAEWDPSGLLKLRRKIDPSGPQHDCKVGCSPNMCKGERSSPELYARSKLTSPIIQAMSSTPSSSGTGPSSTASSTSVTARTTSALFSACGSTYRHLDATAHSADFTFLRQDVVFCRRYRGLYNLIKPYEDEGRLHCSVQYWTGAWEAEALLDQL